MSVSSTRGMYTTLDGTTSSHSTVGALSSTGITDGLVFTTVTMGDTTETTVNSTYTIVNATTLDGSPSDIPLTSLDMLSARGHNVLGVLLLLSGTTSVVMNLMVIVLFHKSKKLRSPTNVFIESLAWSDFFLGALGNSIAAQASFEHEWVLGKDGCTFYAFIMTFFGLASLINLSAIAMDRYIVIVQPMQKYRVTLRVAYVATGVCWLYALLWSVFPLIGWNAYTFEGVHTSCSITWKTKDPAYIAYVFFLLVFCLVLPMVAIFVSYFYIYMTVRHVAEASLQTSTQLGQKQKEVERKLAKTILLMVVAFLLSWLPYAVVSVTGTLSHDPDTISPVGQAMPALIAKCGCMWNPLIYVGTNDVCRQELRQLCGGGDQHKIHAEQQAAKANAAGDETTNNVTDFPLQPSRAFSNSCTSPSPSHQYNHPMTGSTLCVDA